MRLHRLAEIVQRHRIQRADFDHAGIIDQNIELTKMVFHLLDHRVHVRLIANIANNGQHVAPASFEIGFGRLQLFLVAGTNRHACPRSDKLPGQFEPRIRANHP